MQFARFGKDAQFALCILCTMKLSLTSFPLSSNLKLDIQLTLDKGLVVRFVLTGEIPSSPCVLHWGITLVDKPNLWIAPDRSSRAMKHFEWDGTTQVPGACQTTFPQQSHIIEFAFPTVDKSTPQHELPRTIEFVLCFQPNHWVKNGKANFSVPVVSFLQSVFGEAQLEDAVTTVVGKRLAKVPSSLTRSYRWTVQGYGSEFNLLCFVLSDNPDFCAVFLLTDTPHPLLLHWGCSASVGGQWRRPDLGCLRLTDDEAEEFTCHPVDEKAVQTEFSYFRKSTGQSSIQYLRLLIGSSIVPPVIKFVLKEGKSNYWFKDKNASDFVVEIPPNDAYEKKKKEFEAQAEARRRDEEEERKKRESQWLEALSQFRSKREERQSSADVAFKAFNLSDDGGDVDVVASFNDDDSIIHVDIIGCFRSRVTVHWGVVGVAGSRQRFAPQEWRCPLESYRPRNTVVIDPNRSCESPMEPVQSDDAPGSVAQPGSAAQPGSVAQKFPFWQKVTLTIPGKREAPGSDSDPGVAPEVMGIAFVLRETNGSRWFKDRDNTDFVVRLAALASRWSGPHPDIVEEIIAAEVGWHQMTLMHRYNLINSAVSKWHDEQGTSDNNNQSALLRTWTGLFRPEGLCNITDAPGSTVPSKNLSEERGQSFVARHKDNCEFWAWIFVWSRFSYMGLMDWQRNYNTKPKDLAHSTECLTHKLASLWVRWPEYRLLIRLVLSTVARGGNQGQAIRDRILDIMHKHRIPENRANFYEQWHQKLHNNTTPDDIPICLGVIAYLKSNNLDDYWRVLSSHGITKDRLASYERPIHSDPYCVHSDIGSLIYDFEQYLDILKDVHDALDLKKAFDHAARFLPRDAVEAVQDVVRCTTVSGVSLKRGAAPQNLSRDDLHNRFNQVSWARGKVLALVTNKSRSPEEIRELLFLDFALEQQQNLALQGSPEFTLPQIAKQLVDMVASLSGHDHIHEELAAAARDWVTFANDCANNKFSTGIESALMLKALSDRLTLLVGSLVQQWQEWFGPKAEFLGKQVGVEQKIINVFVDEILRGSILFGVSLSLKRLEPILRQAAHLPPWQMISIVEKATGHLCQVDQLVDIQDKVFDCPTVLISGRVSGDEEIPSGVQAVLVRSAAESPDILSHVSVRARNAHVFLAVCFDPPIMEELDKLLGQWVEVSCRGGDVHFRVVEPPSRQRLERLESRRLLKSFDRLKSEAGIIDDLAVSGQKATQMDFTTASAMWVVSPQEFTRSLVGSKSLNLERLREQLPPAIIRPQAVALPYGCMQKTLSTGSNKQRVLAPLTICLAKLKTDTSNKEASEIFREARKLIGLLEFPRELQQNMEKLMKNEDGRLLLLYEQNGPQAAWKAICDVWASMFALRPWISLSKARRQYHDLNMAVLVQDLLPANYAFVLHSKNPFGQENGEMYGEIVLGLGEVLVGNAPGRALSWRMKRDGEPEIVSFPSKQFALRSSACLIFRSDSNGEDLEGFAGAGLFESVSAKDYERIVLSYSKIRLIQDREYRRSLLKKIGNLAFQIEDVFGNPMDIEGVVLDEDTLGIVQARPQV